MSPAPIIFTAEFAAFVIDHNRVKTASGRNAGHRFTHGREAITTGTLITGVRLGLEDLTIGDLLPKVVCAPQL